MKDCYLEKEPNRTVSNDVFLGLIKALFDTCSRTVSSISPLFSLLCEPHTGRLTRTRRSISGHYSHPPAGPRAGWPWWHPACSPPWCARHCPPRRAPAPAGRSACDPGNPSFTRSPATAAKRLRGRKPQTQAEEPQKRKLQHRAARQKRNDSVNSPLRKALPGWEVQVTPFHFTSRLQELLSVKDRVKRDIRVPPVVGRRKNSSQVVTGPRAPAPLTHHWEELRRSRTPRGKSTGKPPDD